MPVFRIVRRVDAFVESYADVEADSAVEAVCAARDREERQTWVEADVLTYDAREFVALDETGEEIPETLRGDF